MTQTASRQHRDEVRGLWLCAALGAALTLPGALLTWPAHSVTWSAWLALAYVGVFSMWAGFFAWYRGMALGGALKVNQVQLLLGEPLETVTLGFALAVVATVFVGKRFVSAPRALTIAPVVASHTP